MNTLQTLKINVNYLPNFQNKTFFFVDYVMFGRKIASHKHNLFFYDLSVSVPMRFIVV